VRRTAAGSKGPGLKTAADAKAGTADVERKPAEVAPPQERAAGRRRRRSGAQSVGGATCVHRARARREIGTGQGRADRRRPKWPEEHGRRSKQAKGGLAQDRRRPNWPEEHDQRSEHVKGELVPHQLH